MAYSLPYSSFITKRFYTPPSRRTWSKQHPKFATPRPLVDPYNLSRLHPKKEWWKLSDRKLHPVTFMGHPDVISNEKLGGFIYAEQMDSPTLAVILYRCLSKGVYNVYIWDKLVAQAKRLCIKMDTACISYIYLYLSKSNVTDIHLIGSFIGRVIALLPEFTLIECANLVKAMHNTHYFHASTLRAIIGQAKNLMLARNNIPVRDSIAFLSSISPLYNGLFLSDSENKSRVSSLVDYELLGLLFDEIHVHSIDLVDKSLLLSALASCNEIGVITRYLHNYCKLPVEKMINHSREGDFIDAPGLYIHLAKAIHLFKLGSLGDKLFEMLEKKCYLLTIDEVYQFLWVCSWDSQAPKSFYKLLIKRVINHNGKNDVNDQYRVMALIGLYKYEHFAQLKDRFNAIDIDKLGIYYKLLLARHLSHNESPINICLDDLIAKIKPKLPWQFCHLSETLANLQRSTPESDMNLLDCPSYNLDHFDFISLFRGNHLSENFTSVAEKLILGVLDGPPDGIKCSHMMLALALKYIKTPECAAKIVDKFAGLKWDPNLESFIDFNSKYKSLILKAMEKFAIKHRKALEKCKYNL